MSSGRFVTRGLLVAVVVTLVSVGNALACTGVTGISPATGPVAGGTVVAIAGDGFSCGPGATAVKFGGTSAAFTVNTDSSITATAPAGSGTVDVTVTIGGTDYTSPTQFVYTGTQTNSQNIDSLQNNLAPTVANTSATNTANAIDSGIGAGFSNNGPATSFGPGGGFVSFAAQPQSEIARRTDEAFSALAYAGGSKVPNYDKATPRLDREWSAWASIRGTGWKASEASGNDLKGSQINITAGIGRKLNADTLIGVVVGYEHFKYDVASLAGSLKGDGETIGGYFARRFGGNLRFDAALAWSNVDYDATAATATGSFKGSRWLATTGLTGDHRFGAYTLEPSAKLYVLWERQTAWTDTLGAAHSDRNFSSGRAAFGSSIARPFATAGGWALAPYAGLYGDWRFSSDNAVTTGAPVANIKDGWSGRVTAGLSATGARGTNFTLGGEYGGLGASYKIWSGNVRASVPF